MANPQLYPLELDSLTNEPFLRLRNHKNIIITPPRPDDIDCYSRIIDDPRVHDWLVGPAVPHLREHAEAWYNVIKPFSETVLAELDAVKDRDDLITVDKCPVRAIREVLDDGKDVYLGDIGFTRLRDGRILAPPGTDADKELVDRYATKNSERVTGDPDIVWTIGYYLAPSHHGQGIMSDAVETILHNWAIPRMNARVVSVSTLRGNQASVRVFQKNGFHLTGLRENHMEAKGKMRDLHILEWYLEGNSVTQSSQISNH